ncbi:hypothetical protein [Denitrobaculum tricleocarpae]|uniref:Uncharacterized protein n=1 Tax=Denitrobaculum tricleocarpae TaxID=2591009 RepID=A0A545TAW1_9PROT|nr:hypothetical protein [Denitrobaculum tricleocarpae]TQV74347.1 hypothetical protein FKG95_23980 [Denitrobaculum tricleocarpae]
MTMVSDWFGPAERDEYETEQTERDHSARTPVSDEANSGRQAKAPTVLRPLDPALKKLLERGDDRLLRDVGLSSDSAFAEVAKFWADWSRRRGPWGL